MTAARPVPVVNDDTDAFWHGGADGELRITCCTACERFFHPPAPICPHCYSRSIEARTVSGRARLDSYTVAERPWIAGYDPPYVIARVVLAEQPDLILLTNLVECEPSEVRTGMEVEVVFEQREDVFVPMFRPAR